MPARELRKHYGHHWRTVTRPAVLARSQNACERCHRPWKPIDVAHLVIPPGEPGHDDPTNLSALCRPCHRAHDYAGWAAKFAAWLKRAREKRVDARDRARPILRYLEEGTTDEQEACNPR